MREQGDISEVRNKPDVKSLELTGGSLNDRPQDRLHHEFGPTVNLDLRDEGQLPNTVVVEALLLLGEVDDVDDEPGPLPELPGIQGVSPQPTMRWLTLEYKL